MSKSVVICCDGTNNSISGPLTNVAKLSLIALRTPGVQHVYYDAGVGVEAMPGLVTRVGRTLSRCSGSAFGTGLVRNVTEAYLELVDHMAPDDRVFLFGFSRGAYTVRVLAGLLQHFGRLRPEHRWMVSEVVTKYRGLFPQEGSAADKDPVRRREWLERTFSEAAATKSSYGVECPVHFMGIWDTVSSVGWIHDPKHFSNTACMPEVATIRHAVAIDERRAKFRTNRVQAASEGQDLQEVWFPGVHADVGGGYPENQSELARLALRWMLAEATARGLQVSREQVERYGLGADRRPSDEQAEQHESLKGFWWVVEYLKLPHRQRVADSWITETIRYRGRGWRHVNVGDRAHGSLQRRAKSHPVKNPNWREVEASVRWSE